MPDKTDTTSKAVGNNEESTPKAPVDEILSRVIEKIEDADSILVALSKDPSVDEMTAALALTISLDRMGKHATAIYSGKTPNALQFLEPENTFEANTNSLQDFIIALDKEKADHLRYKIEGDFVKVYITPYRTTISEDDLEFSHGEVNVDMVISFNVAAPEDLDAALAQHGRILHDAVSINISNGAPGRIGGLEWNDASMSSVSEMVLKYLDAAGQDIEKDVATALLTGIVAETDRFSNAKTTPTTMAASAELMQKGADQQLVVSHLDEMKETTEKEPTEPEPEKPKNSDPGSIDVSHEDEEIEETENAETTTSTAEPKSESISTTSPTSGPEISPLEAMQMATAESLSKVPETAGEDKTEESVSPEKQLESMISKNTSTNVSTTPQKSLMDELAETSKELVSSQNDANDSKIDDSNSTTSASNSINLKTTDSNSIEPESTSSDSTPELSIDKSDAPEIKPEEAVSDMPEVAAVSTASVPVEQVYSTPSDTVNMNDGVMAPVVEEQPKDYGAMMEEALAEPLNSPAINPAISAAPQVAAAPEVQPTDMVQQQMANLGQPMQTVPNQPLTAEQQNVADLVNQITSQAQSMSGMQPADSQSMAMPAQLPMMPQSSATPQQPTIQQPLVQPPVMQPTMPTPQMPQVSQTMPVSQMPQIPTAPEIPEMPPVQLPLQSEIPSMQPSVPNTQPAVPSMQPAVPSMQPEIPSTQPIMPETQAVAGPEIPPPPVPPVSVAPQDTSGALGIPEAPAGVAPPPEPVNPVVVQPIQDPASVPPVEDPGSFKIPGM